MFSLNLPVKLSDRKRAVLDQVLTSDITEKAIAASELKILAGRDQLVAAIAAVPAKYVKLKAEAEKRALAAHARFEAAVAEKQAAHEEVRAAAAQSMVASRDEGEIRRLQQELRDTADPRLGDARRALLQLRNRSEMQWRFVPPDVKWISEPSLKHPFGAPGKSVVTDRSNREEVDSAKTAVKAAIDRVEAMQLIREGAARADVTAALLDIITKIREPLKAIGLKPFELDDEQEIKETAFLSNRSRETDGSSRPMVISVGAG